MALSHFIKDTNANMLHKLILTQLIEKAFNHYLGLKQADKLPAQLVGHTLGIQLKGLNLTFYCVFNTHKVHINQDCIDTPTLMIAAPPFTLLKMAMSTDTSEALQEPQLQLTGDATIALTLKQYLDHLDIDWEQLLSRILGYTLANKACQAAQQLKSTSQQQRQSLQQNLRDYIQYEISLTPSPETLEDFYQQIDELKMETDLSVSRVDHLQQKLKNRRR